MRMSWKKNCFIKGKRRNNKIKKIGKVGRISSFIFHNEGKLSLISDLKKKKGIPETRPLADFDTDVELKAKDLGFTGDGDIIAYGSTVNKIKDKFKYAQYVIPGHGKFGGVDLIEHTLEMTKK